MKTRHIIIGMLLVIYPFGLYAQGTAFTYQGRLNDGGKPATGTYDLRFGVYDALIDGEILGDTVTNAGVVVSDGLFTVNLQFESWVFLGGEDRWLEIGVRTNGSGSDFVTLSPLQPITATPYAIVAGNLSGPLLSRNFEGAYFNRVSLVDPGNYFSGEFEGWGGSLQGVNAMTLGGVAPSGFWQLGGNAGTVPGTDFLGTTDNRRLEFRVNGMQALRLEPNVIAANVVAGATNNQIWRFIGGSTIIGGSYNSIYAGAATIAGGVQNTIQTDARYSIIGAGALNLIDVAADYSVIGGGNSNLILTNAELSVIADGRENTIEGNAQYGAIGGGYGNKIQTNASSGTISGGAFNKSAAGITVIGGGVNNTIGTAAQSATIGGGSENSIQLNSIFATVGGGELNTIGPNAGFATAAGGQANTVDGHHGMIPGGRNNSAGELAFAAGNGAKAIHIGSFVWADSQNTDFASSASNQFNVRASGGVRFETGGTGLAVDGQAVLAGQIPNSATTATPTNIPNAIVARDGSGNFSGGIITATAFSGDGNGLVGLNANNLSSGLVPDARLASNVARTNQVWLVGNSVPGTQSLGTSDNNPLELKVNNQRGLRLEPTAFNTVNFIAGSRFNSVAAGVVGAMVGGGSSGSLSNLVAANYGTISGGMANKIGSDSVASTIAGGDLGSIGTNSSYSVIGGGIDNGIGANAAEATIGGGQNNDIGGGSGLATIGGGNNNRIAPDADATTIAGGMINVIGTNSVYASIGGGIRNNVGESCIGSTIAGGESNIIDPGTPHSAIGGGHTNRIGNVSHYSTVAGGEGNGIGSNALTGVISGGFNNKLTDNAIYAMIPGGNNNLATNRAFAAGTRAKANHSGAFVWGDATGADVTSTNVNSVTMRASGGYRLFSDGSLVSGVYLATGGSAWTVISDRNAKENFSRVDSRAVLEKVAALPVTTWNYKSQTNGVRHIGPVAQDFKAAFGVGESDTGITTIDADGVALAAIQGLNQKLEEQLRSKEVEIQELKRAVGELRMIVKDLSGPTKR